MCYGHLYDTNWTKPRPLTAFYFTVIRLRFLFVCLFCTNTYTSQDVVRNQQVPFVCNQIKYFTHSTHFFIPYVRFKVTFSISNNNNMSKNTWRNSLDWELLSTIRNGYLDGNCNKTKSFTLEFHFDVFHMKYWRFNLKNMLFVTTMSWPELINACSASFGFCTNVNIHFEWLAILPNSIRRIDITCTARERRWIRH